MHPKTKKFLEIYKLAKKKYSKSSKRLAGECWPEPWQTLMSTILSAQTRDETTIPIAKNLFNNYPTLQSLANANQKRIFQIIKSVNYNKTKSKHIHEAAVYLIINHEGKVPKTIEGLIKIPGVGRKTANLVLSEVYKIPAITVDTHVHRIMNALNILKTKNPKQTELELKKLSPKKYWSSINRYFVLLGKDVPGRNKSKFLAKLKENL